MTSRRGFLKRASAAAGALSLGVLPNVHDAFAATLDAPPIRPLRILILGGTGFIGPYQVRYAVARGHRVTVFNRGKHQADLPASVEHRSGDRAVNDYASLADQTWDVVIDNSATNPKWVHESGQALKSSAARYVFVSSTGALYPYTKRPIDETAAPSVADPAKGDESAEYGVAKARSEQEAEAAFPGRALIIRPHYIVGPGDTSDRFPYWPQRIARGGDVLVPGKVDDAVQLIDVRDLTESMIRLIENGETGVLNAAGPRTTLRWNECLETMHAAVGGDVRWHWVSDYDFLTKFQLDEIVPWVMLSGPNYGMTYISTTKAVAHGLTYRPLADTTRDTLAWWNSPEMSARRAKPHFVITPEKEQAVLAAWAAKR